jgi:hypothetical protein
VRSDETARLYREFATREARGRSPLYEQFALGVADDGDLARLLDGVPPPKRQPNLLFAAVRFLGGMGTDYGSFRSFVLEKQDEVVDLLLHRRTQTNEVGRCATLLPVLARLEGPLALIEVGASAGLCLLPDRYAYRYGDRSVGDPHSPVLLRCQARGQVPVPPRLPDIAWRKGIDIAPVDVTDNEAVRWLEACVWHDQADRIARLLAAVEVARRDPPVVEKGDALEYIADVVSQAPIGATVVVFHSAFMAYLEQGARREFEDRVAGLGVTWISNEGAGIVPSLQGETVIEADERGAFVVAEGTTVLALGDPHGAWLDWIV